VNPEYAGDHVACQNTLGAHAPDGNAHAFNKFLRGAFRYSSTFRLPVADNPEGGEEVNTGPEIKWEAEPATPRPLSRRYFIDRSGFLERKCLGDEIASGPDAHRSMAAEGHQKARIGDPNYSHAHTREKNQSELKDAVDWNPESFARYSPLVRLDQIRTLGPERINDKKFVQAPPKESKANAVAAVTVRSNTELNIGNLIISLP